MYEFASVECLRFNLSNLNPMACLLRMLTGRIYDISDRLYYLEVLIVISKLGRLS